MARTVSAVLYDGRKEEQGIQRVVKEAKMKHYHTDEKNAQIVIALLKAYGIKRVIVSPGTTHMATHNCATCLKGLCFLDAA